jgi:hypothetical protein
MVLRNGLCAALIALLLAGAPADADTILYALTGAGDVLTLDKTTGAGTLVGNSGFNNINAAAADSNGRILTVIVDELVEIDPVTGAGAVITTLVGRPVGFGVRGLAFNSADRLFAVMSRGATSEIDVLAEIHLAAGEVSLIGPTGLTDLQGLAFDANDTLYAIGIFNDLVTLDTANGAASIIGGSGIAADDQTIEFDDNGTLFAARDNLITLEPATGAATVIGPTGFANIRGMALIAVGCAGDLNGDGFTDLTDLGILLADFGCPQPGPCAGDLDGDGDTDLADLGILLADFGCAP